MDDQIIAVVIAVYLLCGVAAGSIAHFESRPRDIVLIHILCGPLVIMLMLFSALLGFLAGAWSDFRGRF
jgi:hypothetical protein